MQQHAHEIVQFYTDDFTKFEIALLSKAERTIIQRRALLRNPGAAPQRSCPVELDYTCVEQVSRVFALRPLNVDGMFEGKLPGCTPVPSFHPNFLSFFCVNASLSLLEWTRAESS